MYALGVHPCRDMYVLWNGSLVLFNVRIASYAYHFLVSSAGPG